MINTTSTQVQLKCLSKMISTNATKEFFYNEKKLINKTMLTFTDSSDTIMEEFFYDEHDRLIKVKTSRESSSGAQSSEVNYLSYEGSTMIQTQQYTFTKSYIKTTFNAHKHIEKELQQKYHKDILLKETLINFDYEKDNLVSTHDKNNIIIRDLEYDNKINPFTQNQSPSYLRYASEPFNYSPHNPINILTQYHINPKSEKVEIMAPIIFLPIMKQLEELCENQVTHFSIQAKFTYLYNEIGYPIAAKSLYTSEELLIGQQEFDINFIYD